MGKKIKITKKQLEEAMDVFVNKQNNENIGQAVNRTKINTEREIGSSKDINYVVPSEEVKESRVFTKKQILECRRNYLKNNSKEYTKSSFLKK